MTIEAEPSTEEQPIPPSGAVSWEHKDTLWCISLFGTAVGAGILFLPITAGQSGFWPLLAVTILIGPMVYLSHRALARFVLSSRVATSDITDVVEEHFGLVAGNLITVLYFFAIYPIVLIYGVGITNTVDSFIVNQMQLQPPPRWLLSLSLILLMMSVMMAGENVMLKVTEFLVYPLIVILFGLSIYLIPRWNYAVVFEVPSAKDFLVTIWLTLPVLVFSFNHSPAISSFAQLQRRDHGSNAVRKSDSILRVTASMLLVFVMFFVFSCIMCLSPEQFIEAKRQNISILSFFANAFDNPVISFLGPVVSFAALVSSFFGHYLGAREGMRGIINQQARNMGFETNSRKLNIFIVLFFILSVWIVAIVNPSILGLIETLIGPLIAAILFLLPMYAIHRVPAMARYKGRVSNVFVTATGIAAVSAIFFQILR
ncbi:HAAAP family serine/threonine permease [Martelella sp. AD-3]|uniref:aromatic amino acid transport family protein n=1 Tax=Martelella sp. AD-3 TaxID=686597 RepID=UPI0007775C91|nr:aromatic amino acid transport family protein [Martelella sp. AD-3]AMM84914.1 HAAAP family serine/threonine permease [Martelella sp. AD-3]